MEDLLYTFLQEYGHLAVLGVLIVCGVGLPLPEEAVLLGAGWVVYHNDGGGWGVFLMILTCMLGILGGDSVSYWMGRKFGPDLLRAAWVRRLMPSQSLHSAHNLFEKHGKKAVFMGRFVVGVRAAINFTAGATGMRWSTFLMMDGLAAILSAPISVWLGWYFGAEIEQAVHWLHQGRNVVLIVLGVLLLAWLVHYLFRRKRKPAEPMTVDDVIEEVRSTHPEGAKKAKGEAEGSTTATAADDGASPGANPETSRETSLQEPSTGSAASPADKEPEGAGRTSAAD